MLVGAHVSTSGGLVAAHERGVDLGCDAIQIFNQSPRMWRTTSWKDDDVAEFRSLMKKGPIKSVVIHAVYLINLGSDDPEVRKKSLVSTKHALRTGDLIGADGVVLHPGSAKKGPVPEAMERICEGIVECLEETENCKLLLEDTAGAGGTIGRSFEELATLIEGAGKHKRIGVCLDCCHLLASGYDIGTIPKMDEVMTSFDKIVGKRRLSAIHVNDSQTPLGSNRDRHADLPEGELGKSGLKAFLSEPRFETLPALLEGAGNHEPDWMRSQVALAKKLRREGVAARKKR
jgi:deoxyribonuclease-4